MSENLKNSPNLLNFLQGVYSIVEYLNTTKDYEV